MSYNANAVYNLAYAEAIAAIKEAESWPNWEALKPQIGRLAKDLNQDRFFNLTTREFLRYCYNEASLEIEEESLSDCEE